MRALATPQHTNHGPVKQESQETLAYQAMSVHGFSGVGVPKGNTALSLLRPGTVLPPAPIPQILPAEIEKVNKVNQRENELLTRFYKMDDTELSRLVAKAVEHPCFSTYEQEVLAGQDVVAFGAEAPEDLCSFHVWLESQVEALNTAATAKHSPSHDATDLDSAASSPADPQQLQQVAAVATQQVERPPEPAQTPSQPAQPKTANMPAVLETHASPPQVAQVETPHTQAAQPAQPETSNMPAVPVEAPSLHASPPQLAQPETSNMPAVPVEAPSLHASPPQLAQPETSNIQYAGCSC